MPLAALLAPQLAKKADEIEAAIGPPQVGYLQAAPPDATPAPDSASDAVQSPSYLTVGQPDLAASGANYPKWLATHQDGTKTALDPRALIQPNDLPAYNSNAPGGKILHDAGELQRAGQPVMASALLAGLGIGVGRKEGREMPIPNAPAEAVVASPAGKPQYHIPLPPAGVPFGTNEAGQSVDSHGHALGYLTRGGPVVLPQLPSLPSDWSQKALESTFGKHLEAMQANVDENGEPTDQFPPGYFDGMSQEKKDKIKLGVKELMKRAAGTKI